MTVKNDRIIRELLTSQSLSQSQQLDHTDLFHSYHAQIRLESDLLLMEWHDCEGNTLIG